MDGVKYHQDAALLAREVDDNTMCNIWVPLVNAPLETVNNSGRVHREPQCNVAVSECDRVEVTLDRPLYVQLMLAA